MTETIPSPPSYPKVGNVLDIDPKSQVKSLCRMAEVYGPIYRLHLPQGNLILLASYELVNEICDEKRFVKRPSGPLVELKAAMHDGLFTADYGNHEWGIAHRILMPAFGPLALRNMFDEMHEIAGQLVMKWARYGPANRIDVTLDFTRLTLDSIAICAMDYRFNSFYQEKLHPFVQAMVDTLVEAGHRTMRPSLLTRMLKSAESTYYKNIEIMQSVAKGIVAERRKKPTQKKDLVNAMLNGKDPKTGEKMSDDNIADNMITLLIAGHETTSGLLSFLFHNFLRYPETFHKAQKEVDEVIGKGQIKVEHLSKLPWITACLRETLRLNPPIPGNGIGPLPQSTENPILLAGGKYAISPDERFFFLTSLVQTDPAIWGDDAMEYRPERCLDGNWEKYPKNAWKPFGNGARACIGRSFAWQECLIVVAMLLQAFDFRFDNPGYKMEIQETLTVKPKDLFMHATLREGIDPIMLGKMLNHDVPADIAMPNGTSKQPTSEIEKAQKPMSIFFGSSMGTCDSLASLLARSAAAHGFKAEVKALDEATKSIPGDHPVVFITASYEGEPPDNAHAFMSWLKTLSGESSLQSVNYAVFGCGNHEWQETYQRIPTLIDETLAQHGAQRMMPRGLADAANNETFNDFESWEEESFWPAIQKKYGSKSSVHKMPLDIEITTSLRSRHLRQDVKGALVLRNELLTVPGVPEKRHVEFQLPTDMTYRAGDYLAVLPVNPKQNVHRAINYFKLPWDAFLTVKAGETHLPRDTPLSTFDVLRAYVELGQVATRKNVETLAQYTEDEAIQTKVKNLAADTYASEIQARNTSVLDLLEQFPAIGLPFEEYLAMLPALRARQYSISSSPLAKPGVCSVTFVVLDALSVDGGDRHFLGVASNYLADLKDGDHTLVAVKPSHASFHLPHDAVNIPIIMICAGTGIAPFRGFVQERAKQIEAGRKLAPALLFMGCRSPSLDAIHFDELSDWAAKGAVDLRMAYSSKPDQSNGAKYVQDRFYQDKKDVIDMFDKGARIYVCGAGVMADGVREKAIAMHQEKLQDEGKSSATDDEANKWFHSLRNERYMSDVFD